MIRPFAAFREARSPTCYLDWAVKIMKLAASVLVMAHVLDNFVGRTAVFIEGRDACLGVVEKVEADEERVRADFRIVPDSFRCHLRFWRAPGDEPIEERLAAPPFGETWDVMVSNKEFYLDEDHWQASFLWGGGFRIFFQPDYVKRFATGDVAWLDDFYSDGDDDEAEGEADGGS